MQHYTTKTGDIVSQILNGKMLVMSDSDIEDQ